MNKSEMKILQAFWEGKSLYQRPRRELSFDYSEEQNKVEAKRDKIDKWKTTSWLEFCKSIMQQDTRYSLIPMSDAFGSRITNGKRGAFGPMCLRRDGEMADIFIMPGAPMLGIHITAGSKFTNMKMNCFPSKTMVWPVLRIADELERQFAREVGIERNKHASPLATSQKRGGNNEHDTSDTFPWIVSDYSLPSDSFTDGR